MKSNPALPGGSLLSKPTWSNAFGVLDHAGFFVFKVGPTAAAPCGAQTRLPHY